MSKNLVIDPKTMKLSDFLEKFNDVAEKTFREKIKPSILRQSVNLIKLEKGRRGAWGTTTKNIENLMP